MRNDYALQMRGPDYFRVDETLTSYERLRLAEGLFVHDVDGVIPVRMDATPGAPTRSSARSVLPLPVGLSAVAVATAVALWGARESKRVRPRERAVETAQ